MRELVFIWLIFVLFALTISLPKEVDKTINFVTEVIENVFSIFQKLFYAFLSIIKMFGNNNFVFNITGVGNGVYNNS